MSNRIYRYKHVRAAVERLFEQALEQVEGGAAARIAADARSSADPFRHRIR